MSIFKKLFPIFLISILGCPKKTSDDDMTLIEKERNDALDELLSKEDDEFEDIPEATEPTEKEENK
jgi:hypothetical protein